MQLIIDGVTLTKAPKPLTARQRHMAQGIKAMWILEGEQYDNAMHNYNRYGTQLGQKVPLWGGFTGHGKFTLREWTPRPKMTKGDWVQHLPAVKRAAQADKQQSNVHAKVWQDNERFLCQPEMYKAHGLKLQRAPRVLGTSILSRLYGHGFAAILLNVSSLTTLRAGRSVSVSSSKGRPSCCRVTARRRQARSTALSRSLSAACQRGCTQMQGAQLRSLRHVTSGRGS